ncbi:MAG TPA: GlsB/YeaQ/YmgE family stress response membrane protein [Burkholderiales bacterium]|nr:GlsB/YeaQ/YmgE family stress response membrane protein [Burkholderiales bacterium]
MSIGIWIVVGVIAGVLASKLVIRSGEGLARDIGLGIAGAIIGGWIFAALNTSEATGLDVFGLVVTIASAGAVLVVYHMLFPHVRSG